MEISENPISFAQRIASLKPEGAYQVLSKALALESTGRDILHFEIGQPDFDQTISYCSASYSVSDGLKHFGK